MPKKILICDDDMKVVKVVSERLKANGYDVVCAFEGLQAVNIAHREKPDLIILDILMPTGGGRDTYKKLHLSTFTWSIPILLFSALPYEQVKKMAEELKVTDFITKPYDPDELLLKINKILGKYT